MPRFILFLMASLIWVSAAQARTVWIDDATGNDSDSGLTQALAKKTIQAGFNICQDGDRIKILAGVYYETLTLTTCNNVWIIAEPRGSVRISLANEAASEGTATWTSQGDNVWRISHGTTPWTMGYWETPTIPWLLHKYTCADLADHVANLDNSTPTIPEYGFCIPNGSSIDVRLPANANPNGKRIMIGTAPFNGRILTLNNSDDVRVDGLIFEGADRGVDATSDSLRTTIRNVEFEHVQNGAFLGDNAVIEWTRYSYPGYAKFEQELFDVDPNDQEQTAASFALEKEYPTSHSNVKEGTLLRMFAGTSMTMTDVVMTENVDGLKSHGFINSTIQRAIFDHSMDNGFEFENDGNGGGTGNVVRESLFQGKGFEHISIQRPTSPETGSLINSVIRIDDDDNCTDFVDRMVKDVLDESGTSYTFDNNLWILDCKDIFRVDNQTNFNNAVIFTDNIVIADAGATQGGLSPTSSNNLLVRSSNQSWITANGGQWVTSTSSLNFINEAGDNYGITSGSSAAGRGPWAVGVNPGVLGTNWPRPLATTYDTSIPSGWTGDVDEEEEEPPGVDVTIEADIMTFVGFETEAQGLFTENLGIKTTQLSGVVATASIPFPGVSGNYLVSVSYQDEDDGVSFLALKVNGTQVGSFSFSADTHLKETTVVTANTPILNGQDVTIECTRNAGEFCRIDQLLFSYLSPASGSLVLGSYPIPAEHCDIGSVTAANKEANSSSELSSLLAGAVAGDIIEVANDVTYNAASYVITASGVAGNPITVTCDVSDRATFQNSEFRVEGDYVRLSHCRFDNTEIEISGDNNWVTRNESFNLSSCSNNGPVYSGITVVGGGQQNKVSHNKLYNYTDCRGLRIRNPTSGMANNLFYRNHLHDFAQGAPGNNSGGGFQSGLSSDDEDKNLFTWFVDNFAENMCGAQAILNIKSSSNRILRNTFSGPGCWLDSGSENRGQVVQSRDGDENHFVANTIGNINNEGSGITVLGLRNRVQDNAMLSEDIVIRPGVWAWNNNPQDNQTVAAHETEVYYNDCVGNDIQNGFTIAQDLTGAVPATDTETFGNTNCTVFQGNQSGYTALGSAPGVTRLAPLVFNGSSTGLLAADDQCSVPAVNHRRRRPVSFK